MIIVEFTLSLNNFKQILIDKYNRYFNFFVDNKRYSVPRILADFLSPNICKMHFHDEAINEFHVKTDQENNGEHFQNFLKLFKFNPTILTVDQKVY